MKQILILSLLYFTSTAYGQENSQTKHKLLTLRYAGIFGYGADIEKGRIGSIAIYPETDSTILFFIDLNRGAPSYNMGSLYGRIQIANDTGTFYFKKPYQKSGCQWFFKFIPNALKIETINDRHECEFGYGVVADGNFKRQSAKTPNSFINAEGKEIFFKEVSPEDYNKE